jgi:hypothetical protein
MRMSLNGQMEMRQSENEVLRKIEVGNQIKFEMKLQEIYDVEKEILGENLLDVEKLYADKKSLSDQMKEFKYRMIDLIRKTCKTNDEEVEIVELKGNEESQKKEVVREDCEAASEKSGRNPPSSSSDNDDPGVFKEDDRSRDKSRKLITPQEQVRNKVIR